MPIIDDSKCPRSSDRADARREGNVPRGLPNRANAADDDVPTEGE